MNTEIANTVHEVASKDCISAYVLADSNMMIQQNALLSSTHI